MLECSISTTMCIVFLFVSPQVSPPSPSTRSPSLATLPYDIIIACNRDEWLSRPARRIHVHSIGSERDAEEVEHGPRLSPDESPGRGCTKDRKAGKRELPMPSSSSSAVMVPSSTSPIRWSFISGIDVRGKGMWAAIRNDGLFGVITNFRETTTWHNDQEIEGGEDGKISAARDATGTRATNIVTSSTRIGTRSRGDIIRALMKTMRNGPSSPSPSSSSSFENESVDPPWRARMRSILSDDRFAGFSVLFGAPHRNHRSERTRTATTTLGTTTDQDIAPKRKSIRQERCRWDIRYMTNRWDAYQTSTSSLTTGAIDESTAHGDVPLTSGIFALSNSLLDVPWPKVERGKAIFRDILLQAAEN